MTQKTVSEELFEEFCAANDLPLHSIVRRSEEDMKTPDYEIRIAQGPLIVEVKQLDLGPSDKANLADLEDKGETDVIIGGSISRIRKKIKNAMPQLKARSKGQLPTMLVLYDTVRLLGDIEKLEVRVAMYGDEVVDIAVPSDPSIHPFVTGHRFGPGQSLSKTQNTSLSCLAVLRHSQGTESTLDVFHNDYAAAPLDVEILSRPTIRHFRLEPTVTEGAFRRWIQV